VAPMKNYIEEWFKKAIEKLTTEGQETIETVPVIANKYNEMTSSSK
jgi:hypothetical protein